MAYYSDRKVGDRRFPGPDGSGEAPQATTQNPGQYFPASDNNAVAQSDQRDKGIQDANHLVGNPYLMRNALNKLDHSLTEGIELMEKEGYNPSKRTPEPKEGTDLLNKLKSWRSELKDIQEFGLARGTEHSPPVEVEDTTRRPSSSAPIVTQEGPMFTD